MFQGYRLRSSGAAIDASSCAGRGGWLSSWEAGRLVDGRRLLSGTASVSGPDPLPGGDGGSACGVDGAGPGDDHRPQRLADEVGATVPLGSGELRRPRLEQAEQRGGDEQRRVGASDHADKEGNGELAATWLAQEAGADDEQRQHRQGG